MKYCARVSSAPGPLGRAVERKMGDLQQAKAWAEGERRRHDDIMEVVGVTSYPLQDSVSDIWRLEGDIWAKVSSSER